MWGLAFKPNTDDIREAPALSIVRALAADGVKVKVHDPEATENFMAALGHVPSEVSIVDDPYQAAEGSDGLILCTEWREYRSPDFDRLKRTLNEPVLFDGRNQWDREHLEGLGFSYYAIGR